MTTLTGLLEFCEDLRQCPKGVRKAIAVSFAKRGVESSYSRAFLQYEWEGEEKKQKKQRVEKQPVDVILLSPPMHAEAPSTAGDVYNMGTAIMGKLSKSGCRICGKALPKGCSAYCSEVCIAANTSDRNRKNYEKRIAATQLAAASSQT